MPPNKSITKTKKPGTAERSLAKAVARHHEARGPTPGQRRIMNAEADARRARIRRAQKLELEIHPNDAQLVLAITQTRKRSANPAYDDRANKRAKIVNAATGERKEVAVARPWELNRALEQPPDPFDLGIGFSAPTTNPITALGLMGRVPVEIRDEILRHLLVSPRGIRVLRGWSLVYPRNKPQLHPAVMHTCHVLRNQGLHILYGENTFVYDLRDPLDSKPATHQVVGGVFEKCVVPINQHGHLIRHIKIRVEANRLIPRDTRRSFELAIRKFLPDGGLVAAASLHTLTLEVPAPCMRDLRWTNWRNEPSRVPIREWFDKSSSAMQALHELQVQWIRVVATDRDDREWETRIDLRYTAKQKSMQQDADHNDYWSSSDDGKAEQAVPNASDFRCINQAFVDNVKKARNHLRSLPWRLEGLTIDPLKAVGQLGLWKEIVRSPEDEEVDAATEHMSLPSNWRDTPGPRRASRASPRSSPRREVLSSPRTRTRRSQQLEMTEDWLESVEQSLEQDEEEEESLFVS
ncbi:Uu.00g093720.m01.CDS01 [Anthostomella pinea]|uniref:Uu.00g093720.m01.CDS01 n=1 Tax=Anthostomella pinea TaxID=933095 RepID=A0AAI8VPG4_9PEZI|nr:Uu.00g093720.m01.CDS01 [Anthostomella pinea]